MNPHRRRALLAVLAVSVLLGALAMGSALWWGGNRHPLTLVPQSALLLLGFWVIDRTRTFADPVRLRELHILVRAMPASAYSSGRDGVLLWRVQRRKRSAIVCRLSQAALAEAELAAGQPVSYDVFSVKEYTISRYHGSYILNRDTGGAWRFSSPYRHTRRSSPREMMFAVRTGAAYICPVPGDRLRQQCRDLG
ncbi:hypothetical protein [Planomonospora algeriensis]